MLHVIFFALGAPFSHVIVIFVASSTYLTGFVVLKSYSHCYPFTVQGVSKKVSIKNFNSYLFITLIHHFLISLDSVYIVSFVWHFNKLKKLFIEIDEFQPYHTNWKCPLNSNKVLLDQFDFFMLFVGICWMLSVLNSIRPLLAIVYCL